MMSTHKNYFTSLLIFFIILICFTHFSICGPNIADTLSLVYPRQTHTCAVLYSGENFTHNSFNITQSQQISAFSEHNINSEDVWNTTLSLRVTNRCSFTACNQTYFDGTCHKFEENVANIPTEFQGIGSANCTCESDCKCEDINLRKTECARAYLGRGCNSCHAYYTDFRNKKPYFGDIFNTKITSIVVRPGCQLELFDEEDYEGESEILEGVTEIWTKEINSYECTCTTGDPNVMSIQEIRPNWYPHMIQIPDTSDAILNLLKLNNTSRHPGLLSALQSTKSKRSPRNAYILLLGLTGAGKSSSINLLFDNPNITRVGDGGSITSDIHEFRIPIQVDELGISNAELRVIDTPGLGDTRALENDARFLATLENFLNNHEDLSKYKPNVILIFSKFNDNRFQGDNAAFVKMLRGIELFRDRLTDKMFSNVVFVLTHYMSETKATTRRPTKRLSAIRKTIQDFSLFPKPISIAVAENQAQEEDLPMLNGYYKLPNGDFYPRNLFDKIQQLTTSGLDPMGEAIIRTAFRNADNFNITPLSYPLVDSKQNANVTKYLGILTAANFKIEDTEVSRALSVAFETLDAELNQKFPDALPYLQRAFNIRNINFKRNVPRTTVEIVKLLKEIRLNEATMYLMEKAFTLKLPEYQEFSHLIVGYGYDIINDVTLSTTPFVLGQNMISDIGYLMPSTLTCKIEYSVRNIYEHFTDIGGYLDHRLQNLNVGTGSIPISSFQGTLKPGKSVNSTGTVFSALREYRTYELILNDKVELTKEFVDTVKKLPIYNENDYEGVESWKQFFQRYGTHVVRSAHGGGSIEIQMKTKEPKDTVFNIIQYAEDINLGVINELDLNTNETEYTLRFKGGDLKYYASTLSGMTRSNAAKLLENWKDSLANSPVMLTAHDTKLLPISEIVKKIGRNISAEVQYAALALYNSTLRYVPQTSSLPPSAREEVTSILNPESNKMAYLFTKFIQESRNSSDRIDRIWIEMQNEIKEREATRERERAEEIKLERERLAEIEQARLNDIERQKQRQIELEKQIEDLRKEALKMEAEERKRKEEERRRREEEERRRREEEERRKREEQTRMREEEEAENFESWCRWDGRYHDDCEFV